MSATTTFGGRWRRSALGLAGWLALSFGAAAAGAFFIPGEWYASLRKPAWNPPGWIFGPVWTVLYTTMAIAAWMVWKRGGFRGQRAALSLYLAQLALNAIWTPLFFGLKQIALGFADIVVLWLVLLATAVAFWKVRRVAGLLLAPYLAWISFAAVLNGTLWRLNP